MVLKTPEVTTEKKSVLTKEEIGIISKGPQGIFVVGLLSKIRRTGESLDSVYRKYRHLPGNLEHDPELEQARDFLLKNTKLFGLPTASAAPASASPGRSASGKP